MYNTLVNIALAAIEGMALIASPCILPILPIILAASLEGSRRRPIGIIIGLVTSFAIFTFFSRTIVQHFGFDTNIIRNISFTLLLMLGSIMISSYLTEKFQLFTQGLANLGLKLSNNSQAEGFISGVLFGSLIGLIWTPCAGPILAAAIVQTILQQSTLTSFLIILAFAAGASLPMLFITFFSRELATKFSSLQTKAQLIRKLVGMILIGTVLYLMYDNTIMLPPEQAHDSQTIPGKELQNGLKQSYTAPELQSITAWINSKPLQIEQLKGKVILVDFWAYSCINCARTIPYLVSWEKKYRDKGLVIIGVHSPEFDFERDQQNVTNAIHKYGILYPVALDNDFATWLNYHNHYWPAHYLIDKSGKVVYEHFGEGEYNTTENNIRYLLGLNDKVKEQTVNMDQKFPGTAETYLGYSRADHFASKQKAKKDKIGNYSYPQKLPLHSWALSGSWTINSEKIVSQQKNSAIKLHFNAKAVYAVMGSADATKPIKLTVLYNGGTVKQETVADHTLYSMLELRDETDGFIELISSEPGLELYTFTFG